MSSWDAEVAVVGLGAWGSCALWQIASRGVDALGIEQFHPGHAWGASHGGSRMFRVTCLEHPELVPLARRSLELWHELAGLTGTPLFENRGGLLIGPEGGRVVGGTLRAARRHGIHVERLAPPELRERFGQHAEPGPDDIAVWEPSAGILRPEEAVRAATGLARSTGARVVTGTQVHSVELVSGGVELETGGGLIRVRQAVMAIGSWLASLVPGMALTPLRMPITWFRSATGDDRFELDRFPVFMRELPGQEVLWGNGSEKEYGVKLGLEAHGRRPRPIDPDTDDRSAVSEDWADLTRVLERYLPGLEPIPSQVSVCMLTATPDGQFVIGRPGGDPRLILAGGCNAHGFKHASGIGEILADLVTHRPARMPLDFVSPDRAVLK
ncbi:N-methyl-L-tryptophan oxidase [Streptomyces sp. Tu 3180]|uniref:N-methyl-L-tryptophan oxidase n=1 Tax=Streptomyces sp. Tu 3180 TaxID=2682611 RepID=UPI0013599981|nr:N-methyl-L-tryptophan oxidase [Streptomyces sp. Tu 3180]KAF3468935.1 N-methyl-L-tryptophan oxidase [Streptomyces sp. Tu 3180]